jgi:hypothetical protein
MFCALQNEKRPEFFPLSIDKGNDAFHVFDKRPNGTPCYLLPHENNERMDSGGTAGNHARLLCVWVCGHFPATVTAGANHLAHGVLSRWHRWFVWTRPATAL